MIRHININSRRDSIQHGGKKQMTFDRQARRKENTGRTEMIEHLKCSLGNHDIYRRIEMDLH